MRWLIPYIFILLNNSALCQEPEIKRVCPNLNNNSIVWNNPTYPCSNFFFYIIWGSDNINGPFFPVDSVTIASGNNYLHTNASPIRFYYVERRDSCGPIYNHLSDTLGIDDKPTSITILDSASVDILTNKVLLGWRKNPTPDFDKYIVYKDIGTYIALDPAGTRDTFETDNTGSNPGLGAIRYDINTIDSCGNPSVFQNPHTTIYLTRTIDTCLKEVTLNWTSYVGWSKISTYEVYEDNGSGFVLIAATPANINSHKRTIILGNTYDFFIRAVKDTSIRLSSSSNKISVTTRKRIDPTFIKVNYVTTDNENTTKILFSFSADPAAEAKRYSAIFVNENLEEKERLFLSKTDLNVDIQSTLNNTSRYLLRIISEDYCDKQTFQSDSSTNILLTKQETAQRSLKWNSYFTWNNGVQKYMIYRGTGEGNAYSFSLWKESFDTIISDSELLDNILSAGVCYYIEALKAGTSDTVSKSNIICFPNPFTVYVPSAFVPSGYNAFFRPEGNSIDYQASTLQIFDRWGKLVYANNIGKGWDGKDQNGQTCMDGIYLYKAEIISIKQEKQYKNGTVTLLR